MLPKGNMRLANATRIEPSELRKGDAGGLHERYGNARPRYEHQRAISTPGSSAPARWPSRKAMWNKLNNERVKYTIDLDGKQLLPQLQYLTHTLSSELAMTSLSYWRARRNKIPLD